MNVFIYIIPRNNFLKRCCILKLECLTLNYILYKNRRIVQELMSSNSVPLQTGIQILQTVKYASQNFNHFNSYCNFSDANFMITKTKTNNIYLEYNETILNLDITILECTKYREMEEKCSKLY